ncbi:MAG TPA: hypothetical protein VMT16_10945 [Thermoanaerobaculia bacterium]|nr:hypothetical protein [Thermoanaerobaculia bacterium]
MSRDRGRRRLVALAAATWLGLAGVCAWRTAGGASDDAYITYRYAHNLARGDGLVFNPGERVFGATEPGWVLALAAARRLTGAPLHWLGPLLYGASLAALATLLLASVCRSTPSRWPEALAGGTLLVTSSTLWVSQGFGWPLALALLAAAGHWAPQRPALAGSLAGFAVWCRPEAGLGVALLALLELRRNRRVPWLLAGAAAAGVLLGVALATAYYGSPLPHTWVAKQAAAPAGLSALERWRLYHAVDWRFLHGHLGGLAPALFAGGLAGAVPLLRHGGAAARLVVLLAAVLALVQPLLGASYSLWYQIPAVAAVSFALPFALGTVARWLAAHAPAATRPAAFAAAAALAILLLLPWLAHHARFLFAPRQETYLDSYRRAAQWLARTTGPNADLATTEIGILGYWSDRQVEDLRGLVTPRIVPYVAFGDVRWAFLDRPTRFVVVHQRRPRMVTLRRQEWFQEAYLPVQRFADPSGELVIYRRRRWARLPPPPELPAEILAAHGRPAELAARVRRD